MEPISHQRLGISTVVRSGHRHPKHIARRILRLLVRFLLYSSRFWRHLFVAFLKGGEELLKVGYKGPGW